MKRPWLYEGVTTVTSGSSALPGGSMRIPVTGVAKRAPQVEREPEAEREQHRGTLRARRFEVLVVVVEQPARVRVRPRVGHVAVVGAQHADHLAVHGPAPRERLVVPVHARTRDERIDLGEVAAAREPDPEIVV